MDYGVGLLVKKEGTLKTQAWKTRRLRRAWKAGGFSYRPHWPSLCPIVRLFSLPRLCGFLFRSTFSDWIWRYLSFKWI